MRFSLEDAKAGELELPIPSLLRILINEGVELAFSDVSVTGSVLTAQLPANLCAYCSRTPAPLHHWIATSVAQGSPSGCRSTPSRNLRRRPLFMPAIWQRLCSANGCACCSTGRVSTDRVGCLI